METLVDVLVLFIVFLLSYTAYWYLSVPKNLPPGPVGLPLVGYLPFLGNTPYQSMTKLGEKYGPIFSCYLGSRLAIVLHDFDAINEAFVKHGDIFSGRPQEMRHTFPVDNYENIAVSDGEFWKHHRRFAMMLFRDCGVGKINIEPQLMNEINYCIKEIKKCQGKSFDIHHIISLSVANNINVIMLGKRYEYDDTQFLKLVHKFNIIAKLAGAVASFTFLPWLKYIPGVRNMFHVIELRDATNQVDDLLLERVNEHKPNHINGQRKHYVDAYLTEQLETKQKDIFSDKALVSNMRALEGAGFETTSSTLLWAILFMMRHPDVQKKVQEELDIVIGSDRVPCWNDRVRTPYTEATLCEIQRKGNLTPFNVPHRNLEECEIFGYKIPPSSFILANLGNTLNDPKLWNDPDNFRPERFLNNKGELDKPPYFIPFAIGKRRCLGEILAKMELYLYFTSMLQHFTFKSPEGKVPSLDGELGLTNVPKHTFTCAIPRI